MSRQSWLREARQGQQGPVCALGQQSLRASFVPAALSKILEREKVTLQVPFTGLLLHAVGCTGCFMNISTDPYKEPTHFIDGETDAQRFSHLSKVTQILCNKARDDWIDGSERVDVRLVGTEEKEERSERRRKGVEQSQPQLQALAPSTAPWSCLLSLGSGSLGVNPCQSPGPVWQAGSERKVLHSRPCPLTTPQLPCQRAQQSRERPGLANCGSRSAGPSFSLPAHFQLPSNQAQVASVIGLVSGHALPRSGNQRGAA